MREKRFFFTSSTLLFRHDRDTKASTGARSPTLPTRLGAEKASLEREGSQPPSQLAPRPPPVPAHARNVKWNCLAGSSQPSTTKHESQREKNEEERRRLWPPYPRHTHQQEPAGYSPENTSQHTKRGVSLSAQNGGGGKNRISFLFSRPAATARWICDTLLIS